MVVKRKQRGRLWAWIYCALFGVPDDEDDTKSDGNETTATSDSQNRAASPEEKEPMQREVSKTGDR